jgi:iron(III) transport system substrate-binding protein
MSLIIALAATLSACVGPEDEPRGATVPRGEDGLTVITADDGTVTYVNNTMGVIFIEETGEFIMPNPTNDWAAQYIDHYISYEELVRRALVEGEVNWATSGSRGPEAAAEFEALYPGIKVNIHNLGTGDVLERFPREHAAGIYNLDVIRMADSEGVVYNEFKARSLLHSYFPYDILPQIIDPSFLLAGMPSYVVLNIMYYNYRLFPDGSPISSWWDLTRPEWNGRIIVQDPLTEIRYISALTTFVKYADLFEEEYQRVFGRPIELHPNSPTAAHEWMRRFFGNNVIIDNSGSSMNRTVGRPDQNEIFLGWGSSSGIRRNVDENLNLAIAYLTPKLSQPNMNYVYIFDQAPNPYAAMLLARYLLGGQGETLGIGNADRNLEGSWLVRKDIPMHPNAPAALSDLELFVHDGEYVYQNSPAVLDYLLTIR